MSKIKGYSNSHIQIPKGVLKGFSFSKGFINKLGKPERNNYVFCLKNANLNVEEISIDEANTEFGYYENEIEEAFCKYESDFVNAIKNIKKSLKILKKQGYEYIEKDVLAIKKYCSLCWVRSPKLVDGVYKKSALIELLANSPQNVVAYKYLNDSNIVDIYFNNLNFTIIENNTAINYILPQMGILVLGDLSLTNYNVYIPITAKLMILLTTEKTVFENKLVIRTMTEEMVDKFNKKCIEVEFNNNEGILYAKNEQDILRYKEDIKTFRKN